MWGEAAAELALRQLSAALGEKSSHGLVKTLSTKMEKGTSTQPGDKHDETTNTAAASKESTPAAAAATDASGNPSSAAKQASAAPATDDDESDWEELDGM